MFMQRDKILQLLEGGEVCAHLLGRSSRGLTSADFVDVRHLEPALDHREGGLAFDQFERVLAEHFIAPTLQQRQVAHAGGEQLEVLAAGQQARSDVDLAAANLEQQSASYEREHTRWCDRRSDRSTS